MGTPLVPNPARRLAGDGKSRLGYCEAVSGDRFCRDGTEKRTGLSAFSPSHRAIMGSVSDYVVHHADCPVIVVKVQDTATQRVNRSFAGLTLKESDQNVKEYNAPATKEE
jgi:hypothetical protein